MSGVGKVTDISNGNSQKEVDRADFGIPSACQKGLDCGPEQQGFLAGMDPTFTVKSKQPASSQILWSSSSGEKEAGII